MLAALIHAYGPVNVAGGFVLTIIIAFVIKSSIGRL